MRCSSKWRGGAVSENDLDPPNIPVNPPVRRVCESTRNTPLVTTLSPALEALRNGIAILQRCAYLNALLFKDAVIAGDVDDLFCSTVETASRGTVSTFPQRDVKRRLDDHSRLQSSAGVLDLNADRCGARLRVGMRIDEIDLAGEFQCRVSLHS